MADLQDIVDDLEAEIRRPISVEDRRWRLLAHSAQPDEADRVRRSSILTRETAPDVVAWLDGLGLQRARDLVDLPPNDELGMTRRGCLPIRRGDVLLGFLWVIVGDRPLTGAEREALLRGGEEVAANLWERRRAADERFRRTQDLLRALLAGEDVSADLAATLRWPPVGRFAVALVEGDEDVPDRLRRRRAAGDVAWLTRDGRHVLLIRDPLDGLAAALLDAGARAGGISTPITALAEAAAALRQAEIAALCARARPGSPPIAAHAHLGAWALAADLWDAAGRPAAPPVIAKLAAHRRGEQLLQALEGLLEAGGDVADAAKALHLHRATLYRRLERVEEIAGLDLASGDDRLLAHLGLRLHRLSQA